MKPTLTWRDMGFLTCANTPMFVFAVAIESNEWIVRSSYGVDIASGTADTLEAAQVAAEQAARAVLQAELERLG